MIRFFRNNNPISFILLPILALSLWLGNIFSAPNEVVYTMPLYKLLINPLTAYHVPATITGLVLVIIEAFMLNFIINENEILSRPSFLPALTYIALMSCDTQLLTLYPLLFANFFIILALHRIMSSYRKDTAFSNAFDAGFLFSIASLFYFPSIGFIPLLLIGFILFRPFNWREWVISFIGVIVPYTFVFTYYFWTDAFGSLWQIQMFYPGRKQLQLISPGFYVMISVVSFIILLSFLRLFVGLGDASQKNRKGISLLVWLFILSLFSIFLCPDITLRNFSVIAIPASVFVSSYFLNVRKVQFADFLFTVLFVSIIVNHLVSYLTQ